MGPKSGHHAVTQSGEELFNCTQCTYSFATRAHLKVHMSTHSKHRKSISSEISATINHNHGRAKTFQLALPPCHQFVAIWEKSRFLAKKSNFCHTSPILVNDPFVALGEAVHFPPWDRFFDFMFQSYSSFRKKFRLTCQKVFPLPTVGASSASNSPSALNAQTLRARAGLLLYYQVDKTTN